MRLSRQDAEGLVHHKMRVLTKAIEESPSQMTLSHIRPWIEDIVRFIDEYKAEENERFQRLRAEMAAENDAKITPEPAI